MLPSSRSIRGELERMRREMDRIWDRFSKEHPTSTLQEDWYPALNLAETPDSLFAELEAPGINPEDIDISVTGEMLTFKGEKKRQAHREKAHYHLEERVSGKFSRSVRLPIVVDPDQVEAHYKDGILLVTMRKIEAVKGKRIEVQTD